MLKLYDFFIGLPIVDLSRQIDNTAYTSTFVSLKAVHARLNTATL